MRVFCGCLRKCGNSHCWLSIAFGNALVPNRAAVDVLHSGKLLESPFPMQRRRPQRLHIGTRHWTEKQAGTPLRTYR